MSSQSKSRQITPQEWILDYFCPTVSVLSSLGAEELCAKNNLSLTEILQPFSKLTASLTVKDPEGVNHSLPGLSVSFQDFRKDPSRLLTPKLLSDLVSSCTHHSTATATAIRDYGDSCGRSWSVEAPSFTPWFDLWMRMYVHGSVPVSDHEFCRHHVACVVAASSASQDPLADLRVLVDTQHRHQQDKPNSYPQYMAQSVLKYYVLVHDAYEAADERAQEVFGQMKVAFGASACHLLQINSRKGGREEGDGGDGEEEPNPLAEHWMNHSGQNRFCNVDTRREGMGVTVITTAETASANVIAKEKDSNAAAPEKESALNDHPLVMDHPLARSSEDDPSRTPSPPANPVFATKKALVPVTERNIASHLTSNDIDRIRIFIRDFCTHGLIPYLEHLMRQLNDPVANRSKSRSFLVGAKRWFGQNKPGAAGSGTSIVYSREATELQMRKLGDLYFMLRMFKAAYSCFHTCKKEFQSDEAWNYYAGATEMAALATFMQGEINSKRYPTHYMEDSVTKYLHVCQMPEFAVRATLFDAMCLKSLGLFQDAASRLMRMTSEQKDLRSGLLFEQTAFCHLLSKPNPYVRKYAFHIILAGYRFAKAGQKEHAIRTYQQGFQIYEKRGWKVAEEHILYTLGHQALLMKDFDVAVSLFNNLLSGERLPSSNSLQQMCHLREFFIVHHMREKEAGRSSTEAGSNRRSTSSLLTVPLFRAQQSVVDLTCRDWSGGDIMGLEKVHSDWNWQPLERVIRDNARGREIVTALPTCQPVFTAASNNSLAPQATVGEIVRVVIPVENRFQTALLLKNVQLTWKFKKRGSNEDWVNGETLSAEQQAQIISVQVVPKFNLEKNSTARIVLGFVPLCPGTIMVTGVEYSMRAQFPQTVDTDYTIRGMQEFSLRGPRLKATKEQRTTVSYGQDLRLYFEVGEHRPRLDVQLKMPDSIFQGEVRKLNMTLANKGKVPLKELVLVHCKPGMFSVRGEGKSGKDAPLFDLPIVRDPTLKETRDDGAEQVSLPLDFLRLPDNRLKAGESRSIPIWMRAPEQVGRYDMKLYFYYQRDDEAAESKLGERIFATSCHIKVLPLVTASASLKPVDAFANERSDALTIHVSGVGKEVGAAQTERIVVAQIALVSHHRILSATNNVKKKSVHKLDSSCMTLTVKELPQASESKVNVSSINLPDCSSPAAHHRPQLDFLKTGFGDSVRGRPAALAQDLVSVFWQQNPPSGAQTPEVISGQLVVPLRHQLSHSSSSSHDETDCTVSASQCPQSPLVSVRVQVSSHIDHDFSKSSNIFCVVPCSLTLTTSSAVTSPVVVKTSVNEDKEVDEGCSLVGVRSGEHRLNPGQTITLSVGVMVTAPGVYQSTAFSLKTQLDEDEEGKQTRRRRKQTKAPEDKAVPVKMCFFVRQAQNA